MIVRNMNIGPSYIILALRLELEIAYQTSED